MIFLSVMVGVKGHFAVTIIKTIIIVFGIPPPSGRVCWEAPTGFWSECPVFEGLFGGLGS